MGKGGSFTEDLQVAEDAERVLAALKLGGPQDLYQLSEEHGDLGLTQKAVGLLVEKQLVEERNSIMPSFSDDPYNRIFGLKASRAWQKGVREW